MTSISRLPKKHPKLTALYKEIDKLQDQIDFLIEELETFRKWGELNENGHLINCGCLKCKGY